MKTVKNIFENIEHLASPNKSCHLVLLNDKEKEIFERFTIGARLTGLGGYNEWKNSVLKNMNIHIGYEYNSDDIRLRVTNIRICKISDIREYEWQSLGIEKGFGFNPLTQQFASNYYFHYDDTVQSYSTLNDALFALCRIDDMEQDVNEGSLVCIIQYAQ